MFCISNYERFFFTIVSIIELYLWPGHSIYIIFSIDTICNNKTSGTDYNKNINCHETRNVIEINRYIDGIKNANNNDRKSVEIPVHTSGFIHTYNTIK